MGIRIVGMSKVNHYKILRISTDASVKEIKTAYRKLALLYHPDAGEGADKERFLAISDAVEVLSDPQKRLEYDRRLSDGTWSSVAAPATPKTTVYTPYANGPSGKTVDRRHFNVDVWNYYHYGDPMPRTENFSKEEPVVKKKRYESSRPQPPPQKMGDEEMTEFHRFIKSEVKSKVDKKKKEDMDTCVVS